MRITRAERGFLLLADSRGRRRRYAAVVAGLRLRVGRRRGARPAPRRSAGHLHARSCARPWRPGRRWPPATRWPIPRSACAQSVILMDLRTIVCIPLRSPRAERRRGGAPRALGALYVDNQETSAPFSADSLQDGRGPGPPRRPRHRERPALRARAAHHRGAAPGAEAAPAVGEAGHHRPDGGRHRPRAQHPAHLHHGQPGAAAGAARAPAAAGDAGLHRRGGGAHQEPGPEPARLQPPLPGGARRRSTSTR